MRKSSSLNPEDPSFQPEKSPSVLPNIRPVPTCTHLTPLTPPKQSQKLVQQNLKAGSSPRQFTLNLPQSQIWSHP